MKLQRFVASNDARAILMIHKTLGPDALIYSTRSVDEGVEILAGLPLEEQAEAVPQPPVEKETPALYAVIEKLNSKMMSLEKNIQDLQTHPRKRARRNSKAEAYALKQAMLQYRLDNLGFHGNFCHAFIAEYLRCEPAVGDISDTTIGNALLQHMSVIHHEIFDDSRMCALIGPTGAGKTTTIIKLAKRYIAKYGADSIGFITTDYNDIAGKSVLLYYSRFFSAPLEYANDAKDLDLVLRSMANKKLILIDTNGVSQRDNSNIDMLRNLLESQGEKLSAYITLPCNIQASILDEISRAFMTMNTKGFIFTKEDECITLAPALGVSMSYKKPVAYVCNGQHVDTNIERANAEKIVTSIMHDSAEMKKQAEINLDMNVHRVSTAFITVGKPRYTMPN